MIQKTISLVLGATGLSISAALGFSTDPSSLARNFDTTSATTNAPIVVTAAFTSGAGFALRGFCYSEQIPSGLKVTMLGLTLNGQSVANYTFESDLDSDVYSGCTPYRWVLELPPDFTENNPVPPNATVRIQYSITSPAVGSFNLQQFNWAGYDLVSTNASFGYSESSDAQPVSFNAGPPPSPPILITAVSGMSFSASPGTNPPSQMLGITNGGGGTLSWTVVANGSAPAWLVISPTNGVGNGTVAVSASSAGLAAGSYSKNLTVTAVGATNSPQTVVVNLTVNTPLTLPFQADLTLAGLQSLTVTNTATHNEIPANVLSYALQGPSGANIDTNGVIRWQPTAAQSPSTNLFTTIVSDSGTPQLSATNSFGVAVRVLPTPPAITSLHVSNGLPVIAWTSSAGSGYRVQYVGNLTDPNWTGLSPDVTANGSTAMATDTNGLSPQRFYRVLLLAP